MTTQCCALFMYCIDIPPIFEILYEFLRLNKSLYNISNVCHKFTGIISPEILHNITKYYNKNIEVLVFKVDPEGIIIRPKILPYRELFHVSPIFNIISTELYPLVEIVRLLSKSANKNFTKTYCERCLRITDDLSYTNVLVTESRYDLMKICTYGCLTICTHCVYDKLIYLPFHKLDNNFLPQCPNCHHKLIRGSSYFDTPGYDNDYSCRQCYLDYLAYVNSDNVKSLPNGDSSIIDRKQLINHIHKYLL